MKTVDNLNQRRYRKANPQKRAKNRAWRSQLNWDLNYRITQFILFRPLLAYNDVYTDECEKNREYNPRPYKHGNQPGAEMHCGVEAFASFKETP